MSSIQDLIGKIEKNQKKSEKTVPKKTKKNSPEDIQKAREKFAEKKQTAPRKKNGIQKKSEFSGKNTEKKGGEKKAQNTKPSPDKNRKIGKNSGKKSAQKTKSQVKKRFFVTQVCTSKKSCGEKFGPYVWERLCNDHNQDPECDSFEIQGFRFEQSPCQGACKKSANIRLKEEKAEKHTQFSYLTPIKASKLIKIIKSGASPENIKRI